MGVYYFFYNISKNKQNNHVINGCDFVAKFHMYTENEQRDLFEKCIELNNWNGNDVILAVPDYECDVIKYDGRDGKKIEYDNSLKNIILS